MFEAIGISLFLYGILSGVEGVTSKMVDVRLQQAVAAWIKQNPGFSVVQNSGVWEVYATLLDRDIVEGVFPGKLGEAEWLRQQARARAREFMPVLKRAA